MKPVWARGLIILALLGAACAAPAAAPSRPPAAPAQPTPAEATASPAVASGAAVPVVSPNPAEWERLKAAGRREGKVTVAGPPFPGVRNAIAEQFPKAHDIAVDYLSLTGGEVIARIEREARANQVTIDLAIGGSSGCWVMAERDQIEEVTKLLVDPEILAPSVWRGGAPRLIKPSPGMPRDFYCGIQTAEWVMTDLFVNPTIVPPDAIRSWYDLLKPEYKGKIASFDPRRPGSSQTTVGYLNTLFGEQFVRDLYVNQDVVLTGDYRQLSEWVGRGNYPIGIGLSPSPTEILRAEGLPIERVFPADGPGALTGGFGTIMKIKGGPSPNAGAVFMNWFATKEAQELWEREAVETSLRTDVRHTVPDYIIPKPGIEYPIDDYDPAYFFTQRAPVIAKLQDILGR